MKFLEKITKSSDTGPLMIAAGMILIIVGLTIMALGIVWGYVLLGIGLIMLIARAIGYF